MRTLLVTLLVHLLIIQLTITIHLQIQNIKSCNSFNFFSRVLSTARKFHLFWTAFV
uniref:Uncharacterized protein n=1 Tax=Helianthus annuus TaxID=4232 RepID=A0A251UV99_HELAN